VEDVYIKENIRNFEVVIKGGNNEEIAQTIWKCKPLGIQTTGSVSVSLNDSIGQVRTINFSRPQAISLKLHASLLVKTILEQNEIDFLKNALLNFAANNFKLGYEVYPSRFFHVFLSHAKVLDVKNLSLTEVESSSELKTQIKAHQIASLSFDDLDIQQTIEAA
jgi:hypothetical protein